MHGENVYIGVVVEKPEGKRHLGRSCHIWKVKLKWIFKKQDARGLGMDCSCSEWG